MSKEAWIGYIVTFYATCTESISNVQHVLKFTESPKLVSQRHMQKYTQKYNHVLLVSHRHIHKHKQNDRVRNISLIVERLTLEMSERRF